jgi:hypothetical protein
MGAAQKRRLVVQITLYIAPSTTAVMPDHPLKALL